MIFSAATKDFISMTVDHAVVDTYSDRTEYKKGVKDHGFKEVGCVANWGDLRKSIRQEILLHPPTLHSFEDLDRFVEKFLNETKGPNYFGDSAQEVGYHIAGFDQDGNVRLYHRYWGFPRPNPYHKPQDYYCSDHSPTDKKPLHLLYNGRNDIADGVISMLISEIDQQGSVRVDFQNPVDLVCLGDFVARTAAALTPEVQPPFTTHIVLKGNDITSLYNTDNLPIIRDRVEIILNLANPTMANVKFSPPVDISNGSAFFGNPASSAEFEPYIQPTSDPRPYTGGTAVIGWSNPSEG